MKNSTKYFVFNKEADYRKGILQNISVDGAAIKIEDLDSAKPSVFYSRVLDSLERGTLWHRILIRSKSLGDASIKFTFYASDSRTVAVDHVNLDIEELLNQDEVSQEEKERILQPLETGWVFNPEDMLLRGAKGRFFWFKLELFGMGDESPEIHHIKIYLQKENWISYLPEIYQEDKKSKNFLERYLSIFQSIYEDMEEKLNNIAEYFEPDLVSGEMLEWLAEWLAIDDIYVWNETQLRFLVKNSIRLYKYRGTRKSISDMVELYIGQKPYIIENYQLESYLENDRSANLLHGLYGDTNYQFTVIVPENCVPTTKEYKTLLKIISSAKPAHVEANLVVLKPYIFLDKYSYLGMNSVLGQYRQANLDGFTALPFSSIAEKSILQDNSLTGNVEKESET